MKKISLIYIILFFAQCLPVMAQLSAGRVVYERKTNLHKRLKHWEDVKEWIKESDKIKVDEFELYFNDTISCFKPVESDVREDYEWATSKNQTYQNFKTKSKTTFKRIWGEEFLLQDSMITRKWKITDSQRNIAGHICRKAIWQENDSSRIYAWYAEDIEAYSGPESFNGLPGLILGLATEDGGTIYFAKKVEFVKPPLKEVMMPKSKLKPLTTAEFRKRLEKDYGKHKWGKAMLLNNFGGVN